MSLPNETRRWMRCASVATLLSLSLALGACSSTPELKVVPQTVARTIPTQPVKPPELTQPIPEQSYLDQLLNFFSISQPQPK